MADRYIETSDGRVRIPEDLPDAAHCDGGVLVGFREQDVELTFTLSEGGADPFAETTVKSAEGVARIWLSLAELQGLVARLHNAAQRIEAMRTPPDGG